MDVLCPRPLNDERLLPGGLLEQILIKGSQALVEVHIKPAVEDDESIRNVDKDPYRHLFNFGMPFQGEMVHRSSGSYIYTLSGKPILDWTSGQMSSILGHGHPEIVQTISHHAANLDHLYSGMVSPPVTGLAAILTSILPPSLDKAFFLTTGSEANEAAIRIAKLVTGKYEIVALGESWHGITGASLSAQYHSGRKGYGPPMPGNLMLPCPNASSPFFRNPDGSYNWKAELNYGFEMVDKASCGSLAAVIVEPILSSGGMHVLPDGYLQALRVHCDARNMLMILDEAQTALGRTGSMFAFEHDGIIPDILTLSKTLGNGFPLSAVVTSSRIAKTCDERQFFFGTTHVNDPLAAAVGVEVVKISLRENLAARANALGAQLKAALEELQRNNDYIKDIRGRGLLLGVEITSSKPNQPASSLGVSYSHLLKERGLWVHFSPTSSVFRIAPPLTTTEEELDTGIRILNSVFLTKGD